jgi:hypothetical protein
MPENQEPNPLAPGLEEYQAAPAQLPPLIRNQPMTKEQTLEACRIYTTQVIHETEKALIAEIEKMDGRVPSGVELTQYGRHVFHPDDLSSDYFYKGIHLVSVKPHALDEKTGRLGTRIIVHQQPDKTLEERDWTE